MQLNLNDPRFGTLPPDELVSVLLSEFGRPRRDVENAIWAGTKRLDSEDTGAQAYLRTMVRHLVDGTEQPAVPDENGQYRRVLSVHS